MFIDRAHGHVHIGRNELSGVVELYVPFLDVRVDGTPRVDAPDPGNCVL